MEDLIGQHTIHVKGFQGKYRFLSNFWPAEVMYDGEAYPTVEHAYQAAKTLTLGVREQIRRLKAEEAGRAKRVGKTVPLRPDWEEIKVSVMTDLVRQKFRHPHLRQQLLELRGAFLEETNTWGDTFWGVCKGIGQNQLGKILMQVRSEIEQLEQA